MEKKCTHCKKIKEPRFLIREIVYTQKLDKDFCSKECFKEYFRIKFKLTKY